VAAFADHRQLVALRRGSPGPPQRTPAITVK